MAIQTHHHLVSHWFTIEDLFVTGLNLIQWLCLHYECVINIPFIMWGACVFVFFCCVFSSSVIKVWNMIVCLSECVSLFVCTPVCQLYNLFSLLSLWIVPIRLWALCILWRPVWHLFHDHAHGDSRGPLLCDYTAAGLHWGAVLQAGLACPVGCLDLLPWLELAPLLRME